VKYAPDELRPPKAKDAKSVPVPANLYLGTLIDVVVDQACPVSYPVATTF